MDCPVFEPFAGLGVGVANILSSEADRNTDDMVDGGDLAPLFSFLGLGPLKYCIRYMGQGGAIFPRPTV